MNASLQVRTSSYLEKLMHHRRATLAIVTPLILVLLVVAMPAAAQTPDELPPSDSPSDYVPPEPAPGPPPGPAPEVPAEVTEPAAEAKPACRPCCRTVCQPCWCYWPWCCFKWQCVRPTCGNTAASEPTVAAEPPKPDPYAWKPLFDGKTLTGWKIPNFGGEGEVTIEDGAIVMAMGSDMSGIVYTGEPPKTNYELQLEGQRVDGVDFFCTTTFPVGDDFCSFVTGGWGGTIVGLSNVDFYDASDNVTTKFFDFKDKQWYKFRIRVSDTMIECWVDDEQVVKQPRKDHKFDTRIEVDLCKPLGISTWTTTGAVRNIQVRSLKPEEIKAAAEDQEFMQNY